MFFSDMLMPQGGVLAIASNDVVELPSHLQASSNTALASSQANTLDLLDITFVKMADLAHLSSLAQEPIYVPMHGGPGEIPLPPDPKFAKIIDLADSLSCDQTPIYQPMSGWPGDVPLPPDPKFVKIVDFVRQPSIIEPPSYLPMVGEPGDIPLPPDPK